MQKVNIPVVHQVVQLFLSEKARWIVNVQCSVFLILFCDKYNVNVNMQLSKYSQSSKFLVWVSLVVQISVEIP
jgi:hypothetical protein